MFSIGPLQVRLSEIVLSADRWGDLATLEETLRQGLACAMHATETETLPNSAETEAAASEFRYERDLITADEMHAWLDRWGLTVESWTEYLNRLLLRQRWADDLDEIASQHPVSPEEIAESLYVEGICSGEFGRLAHRMAAGLAARERARHEGWLVDGAGDPTDQARLDAAIDQLRVHTVTPAAVRAEVASRQLDWVRVDCDVVTFADLPRAREAVLCVREDGRELAQVAAEARSVLDRAEFYLEEAEPAWRDHLLAARAGELLGPLSQDDGFVLIRVRTKALPAPEEPDIRRRAESSLLDRALEQEISNRVKWHQRL